MKRFDDITGVILAGGKYSPEDADKAMALFEGKPFIQHIAETLQTVFTRVAIVSDRRDQYSFLKLPVYTDIIKGQGPLGGIHAALVNVATEDAFIVPCDLPFIRSSLIRYIIRHAGGSDVAILDTPDAGRPLCGLYRSTCILPIVKNSTRGWYSIQTLLNQVSTTRITPEPAIRPIANHAFRTVNPASGGGGYIAFAMG